MFDLVGMLVLAGVALSSLVLVMGFGVAGEVAAPARSPLVRARARSAARRPVGKVRLEDD